MSEFTRLTPLPDAPPNWMSHYTFRDYTQTIVDRDPGDESDYRRILPMVRIGETLVMCSPSVFNLRWEYHSPDDDGMGDCHGFHRLVDETGEPCTDSDIIRMVRGFWTPPNVVYRRGSIRYTDGI